MFESNVSVETDRESTRKPLQRARCPIEKKNYFCIKLLPVRKKANVFVMQTLFIKKGSSDKEEIYWIK